MYIYTLQTDIANLPQGNFEEPAFNLKKECAICLLNYNSQDKITYLPCDPRHNFHSKCIELWLLQEAKCPICNGIITPELIKNCKPKNESAAYIKLKDEDLFNEQNELHNKKALNEFK